MAGTTAVAVMVVFVPTVGPALHFLDPILQLKLFFSYGLDLLLHFLGLTITYSSKDSKFSTCRLRR